MDPVRAPQQRSASHNSSGSSWGTPLLIIGLIAYVAGGLWTEHFRAEPNPLRAVTGWRWWITPIERNAFLRLPAIQGTLNGVHAFDAQTVWAVGAHGLIVGTTDGGKTWHRGAVLAARPSI